MRVAVAGASGLVGSHLVPFLAGAGHTVVRLTRSAGGGRSSPSPPSSSGGETVGWDPARGTLDAAALEGVDAIVNLAGEPVAERWTAEHKRDIRDSRVSGTGLLARTAASLSRRPKVFVNAAAVGFYGDRKDELLDERSAPGKGFLARVAVEWEEAARPAEQAGVRTVLARFGGVQHPSGGMLARLLPPFQLGGGGRLGDGKQWISWIALTDALRAIRFLLERDALSGPVNVVSPNPVTNEEFGKTLGRVLHRPAVFHAPAFMVRAMFGEMADEILLGGQRVIPRKLLDAGFTFQYPTLEEALRHELRK